MSFATEFHDYQRSPGGLDAASTCSPALVQLRSACARHYGTISLGCYAARAIRGGTAPSSHSYGAAIDLSYRVMGMQRARDELLVYLLAWSREWGIQAVHDYAGCRIWRAGRTPNLEDACTGWWKAQKPSSAGMGQGWATWFHIEVHPSMWADDRIEHTRGITI